MIKNLIALIFILTCGKIFSQDNSEKDFVILTFEMDRNKDSHGKFIYYWIAELKKYEKVDEYKEPEIYSIFLHEFYSSDQLESCCLGKTSYPYSYFTNSKFDFPENYSEYLNSLRDLVKNNRRKIQVIKKQWEKNHKETVTVYATPLRGKLCVCECGDNLYDAEKGSKISFPKGNFTVIENYLTEEKRILLFKDFSKFNFTNTAYRTGK